MQCGKIKIRARYIFSTRPRANKNNLIDDDLKIVTYIISLPLLYEITIQTLKILRELLGTSFKDFRFLRKKYQIKSGRS